MSVPFSLQQPPPALPPPVTMVQPTYPAHPAAHGSIGPVIGVMAVVVMLCAVAVMIGRLCSGRGIMGQGEYDVEGWVETKCSSCVDGRINVVLPSRTNNTAAAAAAAPETVPASTSGQSPQQTTNA